MDNKWFYSMLFKLNRGLGYRCGYTKKSRSSHGYYLVNISNIKNLVKNLLVDKRFFTRDKNFNYNVSNDSNFIYDTQMNWNNNINSCIENYVHSQIDSSSLDDDLKKKEKDIDDRELSKEEKELFDDLEKKEKDIDDRELSKEEKELFDDLEKKEKNFLEDLEKELFDDLEKQRKALEKRFFDDIKKEGKAVLEKMKKRLVDDLEEMSLTKEEEDFLDDQEKALLDEFKKKGEAALEKIQKRLVDDLENIPVTKEEKDFLDDQEKAVLDEDEMKNKGEALRKRFFDYIDKYLDDIDELVKDILEKLEKRLLEEKEEKGLLYDLEKEGKAIEKRLLDYIEMNRKPIEKRLFDARKKHLLDSKKNKAIVNSIFSDIENDKNDIWDDIEWDDIEIENDSDSDETQIKNKKVPIEKFIPLKSDNPMDKFAHLWVACESCYGLNYKEYFKSKLNICEYCGDHLKMSSSDRIELSIDPGTWNPMDEDMFSLDPIQWDLEEEPSERLSFLFNLDAEVEELRLSIKSHLNPIEEPFLKLNSEEEPIELDSEEEPLEEEPSEPISLDPEMEEKRRYLEERIKEIHRSLDSLREKPLEEEPLDSLREKPLEEEPLDSLREKPLEEEPLDSLREKPLEEEPIELDSDEEEEPYLNYCDSYQDRTGLLEAVQTGTGQLNGIPVAIGIMDFEFMGGSMGAVVGEKITRLIEYATNQLLPLIIVCASGGARMQEGSLSLMQMAKISSALYDYQMNQELFYVAILTSPTTGGVTASFGMLGDIIIAEPKAHIAFAGKRVIEEMLKIEVPEGSQSAEILFDKGLVDSIISRKDLKEFLSELFEFHGLCD